MSKLYNTQGDIVKNLSHFFRNLTHFSKPNIKNISYILTAILSSESSNYSDIAKKDQSKALYNSVIKRIYRFLNKKSFNINHFYNLFIKYIIKHYNIRQRENKIRIIFDNVFILKKYSVLVFSLSIGRTSIPLWFKSFKLHNCLKGNKKLIKEDGYVTDDYQSHQHVKEGIDFCKSLFEGRKIDLIYLGDRAFFSIKTFKYLDKIKVKYYIRVKADAIFCSKVYKPDNRTCYKRLRDIPVNLHHSKYFKNIYLTKQNYRCNLAVSRTIILEKGIEIEDIWFIATNSNPRKGIREYSFRFGGIETIFKNMKTNGFYLEETGIKNLHAFNTLFGIICMALTWMVIIGSDLTKNKKNKLIGATKKVKGRIIRVMSLFNAGLIWFHKCLYSTIPLYKLKYSFILYDI